MQNIDLALIAGIDIPFEELQVSVHQPNIYEIALIGETKFFVAIRYLTLTKEDFPEEEERMILGNTNFKILLELLKNSEDTSKKSSIISLLQLIFPEYQPIFMPNSILLNPYNQDLQPLMIDENNYDQFQEILIKIFCIEDLFGKDNTKFNPYNDKAKEIANKLLKARRKIAELKEQEEKNKQSILGKYISILSIGIPISFKECLSYTLYQLILQKKRFDLYFAWDLDLKVKLTGTKTKDQVENWMKDL